MARKGRTENEITSYEEVEPVEDQPQIIDLRKPVEEAPVKEPVAVQKEPVSDVNDLEGRIAELERALAIVMTPIASWSFCEKDDEQFIRAYHRKLRTQLKIRTYDRKD